MKKRTPLIALVALTVLATSACADLTSSSTPDAGSSSPAAVPKTEVPAGGPLNLAFASPINTNQSSLAFEAGLNCYVKVNGGEVTTADAAVQVNKQISDFDTFVTQKPDGITFVAIDTASLDGPISRAKDAGIPTVEVNNPDSKADANVGEDSVLAGATVAELVAKDFPDGAKAVVIKPVYPNPTIEGRYQGFVDAAKDNNIEILGEAGGGASPDAVSEGLELGGQLLTAYPDANVAFAFDGSIALGLGQAAKAAGRDLAIYAVGAGADSIQGLKDGFITSIIELDTFELGLQAASIVDQLKAGEEPENFVVEMTTYTAENADSWTPADQRCP